MDLPPPELADYSAEVDPALLRRAGSVAESPEAARIADLMDRDGYCVVRRSYPDPTRGDYTFAFLRPAPK